MGPIHGQDKHRNGAAGWSPRASKGCCLICLTSCPFLLSQHSALALARLLGRCARGVFDCLLLVGRELWQRIPYQWLKWCALKGYVNAGHAHERVWQGVRASAAVLTLLVESWSRQHIHWRGFATGSSVQKHHRLGKTDWCVREGLLATTTVAHHVVPAWPQYCAC